MTYNELYDAIQDYIEAGDADFLANIPNFVESAEQKIYNAVQLPALRNNVTGTLTSGNQYLTLPTDFLAPHSLAIALDTGEYQYLINKDVNYIREAFPFPAVTGAPTHYAIFSDTSLILGPTPDDSYTAELHYFYYPESIVTAGTTWVGDNYSNALLYGALVEANMFVKGEADMTASYQTQFDDAMAQLKELGDGKNRRDSYRSGQTRLPVR